MFELVIENKLIGIDINSIDVTKNSLKFLLMYSMKKQKVGKEQLDIEFKQNNIASALVGTSETKNKVKKMQENLFPELIDIEIDSSFDVVSNNEDIE